MLNLFLEVGAVLFHMLKDYSFETIHVYDINKNLILCYQTIREADLTIFIDLFIAFHTICHVHQLEPLPIENSFQTINE